MPEDARKENERDFHNRVFAEGTRDGLGRFYRMLGGSDEHLWNQVVDEVEGLDVLEIGCGTGRRTVALAEEGARAVGVDISDVAIEEARVRAGNVGARFQRMDAEALDFPDERFDRVWGTAILHHLDPRRAFGELFRVLRPGGTAIFLEPLAWHPGIALFRLVTPNLRTTDEAPFTLSQLNEYGGAFSAVTIRAYHLLSPAACVLGTGRLAEGLATYLCNIDQQIFRGWPMARHFAWQVVIKLEK